MEPFVPDHGTSHPARRALGVLVGVPVLLVLLAIPVIGLPLSLAWPLAFALVAWVGLIYGRFAVGAWLLSLADANNRWLALVLGLLLGAVLSQLPVVGRLLNLLIFLPSLGTLSAGLYDHRRRTGTTPSTATAEESPAG